MEDRILQLRNVVGNNNSNRVVVLRVAVICVLFCYLPADVFLFRSNTLPYPRVLLHECDTQCVSLIGGADAVGSSLSRGQSLQDRVLFTCHTIVGGGNAS